MRLTTLRVGILTFVLDGGERFALDVRIVRGDDGAIGVLGDAVRSLESESFASVEDAMAAIARTRPTPDDSSVLVECEWRELNAPLVPGEHACGVCGELAFASERYPRRVCPVCKLEAADATGRPLRFSNVDASGGFRAVYADDGTPYPNSECFVRGVPCRAEEHKFGGIVVQTMALNSQIIGR